MPPRAPSTSRLRFTITRVRRSSFSPALGSRSLLRLPCPGAAAEMPQPTAQLEAPRRLHTVPARSERPAAPRQRRPIVPLYTPVAHTTSTADATKKDAAPALVVTSGGSGGVSGGTIGGVAYPPIDILPIWGQFPGIGSTTATATVAAGAMNGTGYTVLPTVGQPFSDVIASFTLTDPNINLADLQATVQWSDPGIPQFGTTSTTTPVDATIASTGDGTFTVSATNTFANPGIYHFIVQISDTPVGAGPTRLVGVAYGQAFVPYPPGIFYPIVDPLPVAWAGSTISAQAPRRLPVAPPADRAPAPRLALPIRRWLRKSRRRLLRSRPGAPTRFPESSPSYRGSSRQAVNRWT